MKPVRRAWLRILAAGGAAGLWPRGSMAKPMPGISDTEIRVGQTAALSGPAAPYGLLARTAMAYFRVLNDAGGIHGRRVRLVVADDQYDPAKSVSAMRRLVEQDPVALMFGSFGTPTNAMQAPLLNLLGVPHLFLATGADQWGDHRALPWSMGFQPSFRAEARIYVKHIIQTDPDARIGLLYQDDDFGRDYLRGVQDVLGRLQAFKLARAASYQTGDSGVEAQLQALKAAGAKYLIIAAIPKFAALALQFTATLSWRPTVYLSLGSAQVPATTAPLHGRSEIAVYSGAFAKWPAESEWDKDPAVQRYRAFMVAQLPGEPVNDSLCVLAYNACELLVRVLRQAGSDLSRENIRHQAENLKDVELPLLLPGITVNTGPADHYPVEQLQMLRWAGSRWRRFGELMSTSEIPFQVGQ